MEKGFTLIELLIVVALIGILTAVVVSSLNPRELMKRGRDSQRITDLATLGRALQLYQTSVGKFPDEKDTVRQSNILPPGQAGPLSNPKSGWIVEDLSDFITKIPTDPLNTTEGNYVYRYMHSDERYEVDGVLEAKSNLEKMKDENDGGNNPDRYEIGTDKELLY